MNLSIHLDTEETQDRHDSIMMINGGVACLSQIAHDCGWEAEAIDETYTGSSEPIESLITDKIEVALSKSQEVVVGFSVLGYNARRSIELTQKLRVKFGSRIRVICGGQHIRNFSEAFLQYSFDAVCVGRGEVTLLQVLSGASGLIRDYGRPAPVAGFRYDGYYGIENRLSEMANQPLGFGDGAIQNIRMLVNESVRGGCAWAAAKKPCNFCALEGITDLLQRDLRSLFIEEEAWAERFGINRVFDVSNQFLPTLDPSKAKQYIDGWLEIRKDYPAADKLRRYAYLTVPSLNIPRLSEIVEVAYVGIDHFCKEGWKSQGKPTSTRKQLWKALNAAKRSGIKIRAGLVLGRYETPESLQALVDGSAELCVRYGGTLDNSGILLTLGIFPVEIISGSEDFRWFRENALSVKAQEIFSRYERQGWISREEQRKLTRHFIKQTSNPNGVSFEDVLAVQSTIVQICRQHGVITNDVDHGKF